MEAKGAEFYVEHVPWSADAAITRYHRLSGLSNRNLFLMVLEAGGPRSRCQPFRFLVRFSSWLADAWPLSCCVLIWQRKRELSHMPSYKVTNPIGLEPTHMTSFNLNYLHKDPSPNTVTYELEGCKNIRSITAWFYFY